MGETIGTNSVKVKVTSPSCIGLTLTVPSLVNPIDLLHIYMPIVMRGSILTVPSLVNPTDLPMKRVNPHSTKPSKPH